MSKEAVEKKSKVKQKVSYTRISVLQNIVDKTPGLAINGLKSDDNDEENIGACLVNYFKGILSEKFQENFFKRFSLLIQETIKEVQEDEGNTDQQK